MSGTLAQDAIYLPSMVGLVKEYKNGYITQIHQHRRAQLLYATCGVMRVKTDHATYTVPPLRALWIPSAMQHEVLMVGDVSLRAMYISKDASESFWPDCCVVKVSPLLRELILHALVDPNDYSVGNEPDLIMQLILRELKLSQDIDTRLPLPHDRRLRLLTDILIKDPGNSETLEMLGNRIGASPRTISRIFLAETGISFRLWRQQLRLLEAICRLSLGHNVATIANDLGYDSHSAFTAMFKRALGEAPGRYWAELQRHRTSHV